eukprot:TRINITY_DN178_c0_g2_i1.p1 TRINITY_DN178_c0_g2~~TRINITY_DN178_c0_g2_i1.p1  ORF type:complete len:488 (-),score=290.63 TRINITY_DN178_c0_g2_i1:22-1485(-)
MSSSSDPINGGAVEADKPVDASSKIEAGAGDGAEDDALFTDPATVILGGIYDAIGSLAHLILAILISYFAGYFGFHVSWAILTLLLVWSLDKKYKQDGWKRRFRLWKRNEKKHQLVAAEKESVEWLNLALRKFYPIYSPEITDAVEGSIITAIEAAMAVPPSPVTAIEVQGVDLGVEPPQLSELKTFNLPGAAWQMDATLSYRSDIRIVVAVSIGGKGLSFKIPIAVKDLVIDGRVRLTLTMAKEPPLYKTLLVSFKAPPTIAIGLKPLKAFDLDKVPGLGQFIRDSIVAAVGTMMVYPQQLPVELGEPRPEGAPSAAVAATADERAEAEIDANAGKPMTAARAKKLAAQRRPEYVGRARVVLKSAAGLRACDKSITGKKTSDAYCRVWCGAAVKRSKVIKSLAPEWAESFDFLVEKARKYQHLELQVYDEDKLGKDDSLGRAIVDFADLVGDGSTDVDAKSFTVPLVGKGALPESEVTVSIQYMTE